MPTLHLKDENRTVIIYEPGEEKKVKEIYKVENGFLTVKKKEKTRNEKIKNGYK